MCGASGHACQAAELGTSTLVGGEGVCWVPSSGSHVVARRVGKQGSRQHFGDVGPAELV